MNRKEYENRCFSPSWIDSDEVIRQASEKRTTEGQTVKEDRLESKRRKDLNTLLKELEEIKYNIEKAAEKQHRLANLMSFYTGEFAK